MARTEGSGKRIWLENNNLKKNDKFTSVIIYCCY